MTTRAAGGGTIASAMTETYPQYPQHHRPGDTDRSHTGLWFLTVTVMFWPRLFIVGFAIFSPLLRHAMSTPVAIAGFLLLPGTTLAYAIMWSISSDGVSGLEWLGVAVGLLLDVTGWLGLKTALNR
jgi:hypothetical protein